MDRETAHITDDLANSYRKLQKYCAGGKNLDKAIKTTAAKVAHDRRLRSDFIRSGLFAKAKFEGKFRQDKTTPLFLHSLFLPSILAYFGEQGPQAILVSLLHDLIEDTDTRPSEIAKLSLKSAGREILPMVKKLTQDKNISDKLPSRGFISPRVRKFIRTLKNSPPSVINVELADRIHDMLDIGYLKQLEPKTAKMRLRNKIARNKEIVSTITKGRDDINKKLLGYFWNLTEK